MTRALVPMKYLKGYPAQLPVALTCLLASQDATPETARWLQLVQCLTEKLPSLAQSPDVNVENLVNAQTLPTLRTLGLAEYKAENTRLTYRGWVLAKSANDEREFKLNLAAVLLQRDGDTWGIVPIVERLRSYPGEPVQVYDIAIELSRKSIDPCQRFKEIPSTKLQLLRELGATVDGGASRLLETLKFYNYADILRRSDGTVTLLDSTLERARNAFSQMVNEDVKQEQFFVVLKKEYASLTHRLKTPFIPVVPYVREAVCRRLHIDGDKFDSLLESLIPEFDDALLLLSPPPKGVPKDRLFSRRGGRFYYLSMYPKTEQRRMQ